MVVFLDTGFESDPSPKQCINDVWTPAGFGNSDVGDGNTEVWVIDANDSRAPPFGMLPGSFKCVYCQDYVTPTTNPFAFLMRTPITTTKLYVRWRQAFNVAALGAQWIPIFWNYSRVRDPSGVIQYYTMPLAIVSLVVGNVGVSPSSDTGLNFSGAQTKPTPISADTWYTFEFYYEYGNPGTVWLKVNDVVVFSFTGNLNPTWPQAGYTYILNIMGFEVGMRAMVNTGGPFLYWLDDVLAQDIAPGVVQRPLTVNSQPIPVPVTLDAQLLGNTPIQVEVLEGAHTLSVPPEVTV